MINTINAWAVNFITLRILIPKHGFLGLMIDKKKSSLAVFVRKKKGLQYGIPQRLSQPALILMPGDNQFTLAKTEFINSSEHLGEKRIIFFGPEGFQIVPFPRFVSLTDKLQ